MFPPPQREELHMFREMTDGFEEEKKQLEKKLNHNPKVVTSSKDTSYRLMNPFFNFSSVGVDGPGLR